MNEKAFEETIKTIVEKWSEDGQGHNDIVGDFVRLESLFASALKSAFNSGLEEGAEIMDLTGKRIAARDVRERKIL